MMPRASTDPATVSRVETSSSGTHEIVADMRLVALGAGMTGSWPIRDRATIGRTPSADIFIDDPSSSRLHCEISRDRKRVRIRDLDSHNGTVVDGVSIVDAYLRDGSIIEIGQRRFRFELGTGETKIPLHPSERFGSAVGRSTAMRRLFAQLMAAAETDATILLIGETGTGKEVLAESIVAASSRREAPFVVVDCGAMPSALLESELFGHERGAFTSAVKSRAGAFEAAHNGTLFLDEVGELPLELQPKLLRALSKREIKRIGRSDYRPIDVRVIAATNRDLREEVDRKTFRSDLYYRLAVIESRVPPLRERLEDLDLLVGAILADLSGAPEVKERLESREAIARMMRHRWPGNIRELRNYLEQCLVVGMMRSFDGSIPPTEPVEEELPLHADEVDTSKPLRLSREEWTGAFERRYLSRLLELHHGNVRAAARAASVDRAYFYRMLWRHKLR